MLMAWYLSIPPQIESTFYNHPASPHRDIFRVSNDPAEGCTGVGRTGWHIDGSFQERPFSHSIYHMVKASQRQRVQTQHNQCDCRIFCYDHQQAPRASATVFVLLAELVEGLTVERRQRWERLWMMSDRRIGPRHPLVYK